MGADMALKPRFCVDFRLSVAADRHGLQPNAVEWSKILELCEFGTILGLIASVGNTQT
jgi:hypothetical protein